MKKRAFVWPETMGRSATGAGEFEVRFVNYCSYLGMVMVSGGLLGSEASTAAVRRSPLLAMTIGAFKFDEAVVLALKFRYLLI